jgi:hypothetical protein
MNHRELNEFIAVPVKLPQVPFLLSSPNFSSSSSSSPSPCSSSCCSSTPPCCYFCCFSWYSSAFLSSCTAGGLMLPLLPSASKRAWTRCSMIVTAMNAVGGLTARLDAPARGRRGGALGRRHVPGVGAHGRQRRGGRQLAAGQRRRLRNTQGDYS